jgi:hypothetical protein
MNNPPDEGDVYISMLDALADELFAALDAEEAARDERLASGDQFSSGT